MRARDISRTKINAPLNKADSESLSRQLNFETPRFWREISFFSLFQAMPQKSCTQRAIGNYEDVLETVTPCTRDKLMNISLADAYTTIHT